jgi:hypothetical protein
VAPSSRASVSSYSPTALITLIPRATASWVAMKPGTAQAESAELAAARKKIRDLEEENKILRKAAAAVEQVVHPKERFRLVAELNGDGVRLSHLKRAVPRTVGEGLRASRGPDWVAGRCSDLCSPRAVGGPGEKPRTYSGRGPCPSSGRCNSCRSAG